MTEWGDGDLVFRPKVVRLGMDRGMEFLISRSLVVHSPDLFAHLGARWEQWVWPLED